jgi:hypothetical protein
MGSAIWEYIWCLDRITREENGIGFVNGGAPVKAKQIARDFKKMGDKTVDEDTVRINLKKLKGEGYLRLRRTPYGQVIEVTNSLKFGIWTPCERTSEKPDSPVIESGGTPTPESRKTPETKKTQQTTRSNKNKPSLYEREGFSEFWKEYPRHEGKEEAAMAWAKFKPEEHPRIMAGLRRWKQSKQWQKDGGQFILYAVRFLRRKRWQETPIDLQPTEAGQGQEHEIVTARIPA